MTPEQFRQHGHEVVDWIADYWSRIGSLPVRSQVSPGEVRASLPPRPPSRASPSPPSSPTSTGSSLPGVTHWQHPGFFGYFPANTSGPSVLGDLVSAGLGVQGMSWVTSPAATELEQHVMDWLADLLGLPAVLPLRRRRRRRRPGLQLRRQPGGPPRRPAPVQHGRDAPARGRPRPGHGLRLVGDPLLDGEGRPHRRARHRRRPDRGGRRRPRHAPGRARRPARAGRRPRLHPGAGLRHGRDDVDDGGRPARRARPDLPEVRGLAARRRRLRGGQRRRPRAARAAGRRGVGRQLHHRRAQVAADRLRRDAVLGRRPRGAHRRPVDPARSTCATPRPRPAPSSTSATGRSRSAAGSVR